MIGQREAVDEDIIEAAAAAGLEGLVIMYGKSDRPQNRGAVVARADTLGLFISGAGVAEPAAT